MPMDVYGPVSFKLVTMIIIFQLCGYIPGEGLHSRFQEHEKIKSLHAVSPKMKSLHAVSPKFAVNFNGIWCTLRLVVLLKLRLIAHCSLSNQGTEVELSDLQYKLRDWLMFRHFASNLHQTNRHPLNSAIWCHIKWPRPLFDIIVEKAKTSVLIFVTSCSFDLNEI